MTLGELIRALEQHPEDMEVRLQGVEAKYGSIEGGAPGRFISYRGYYNQLALESGETYRTDNLPDHAKSRWRRNDTVGKLLERAREAVGATFEGYKGGDYVMSEDTALWLADEGISTGIALIGIREVSGDGDNAPHVLVEGADIGEYA